MPRGARRQREQADARGNAHARGYGRRWQKYARSFLAEHPFCECGDCPEHTVAECVDHIIPVTGPDDPLFWQRTNHQALSFACHRLKTRNEVNGVALRGSTRTKTEADARQDRSGRNAAGPRFRYF